MTKSKEELANEYLENRWVYVPRKNTEAKEVYDDEKKSFLAGYDARQAEVDELRKSKCDQIDQKHWSAAKYEDEIQEIKKDKERLDFMLSQFAMVQRFQDGTCRLWAAAGSMTYETPREAIDAAMKESKDGK